MRSMYITIRTRRAVTGNTRHNKYLRGQFKPQNGNITDQNAKHSKNGDEIKNK